MEPMFVDDSGHARKRPVEHMHILDERGYGYKVPVQSVPSFNLLQSAATNFPKTTVDSFGRTPYMKSLQVNGSHVREAREPQRMDLRLVRYDNDEPVRHRQLERGDVDLEYHRSVLSSTNNLTSREVDIALHSSRSRQVHTKKSPGQYTGSVEGTVSSEPFGEPVDIRISLQQEQFARRVPLCDGSSDAVVGVRSRSSDSVMPQPTDWALTNERDGVPTRRLNSGGDRSVVDGVPKKASRINRLKLKHPDGLNKLQQTIELQRQKASSSKENSCNSSALEHSQIDDTTFVKKVHGDIRQFDDLIINESVLENWRTGIREVTNSASGLPVMPLSSHGVVKLDQQGSSIGGNQTYESRQQGDLISCQPIARRVEHRSSDPVSLKTYSQPPATATDLKVTVATSHRKIASTAQLHNEQPHLPAEKKSSVSHIVKRDADSRPKVGHHSTSDIENKRSQTQPKSQQTDSQPGDLLSKQHQAALLTKPAEEPLLPVSQQADGFALKAADGPSTQLSRPIETHTSRPKVKSFIPATTEGPTHVKINPKALHTEEARQKTKSDISPSSWRKGQKLIRETLGAVKRTQLVQSETIEPDADISVKKSSHTAAAVKAQEIRSVHSSASKNLQSSVNSRVKTPLVVDSRSTELSNSAGSLPEQPDTMDVHVLGETKPASAGSTSISTSHHILALSDDGEEDMICTADDDVHGGTALPVEKSGVDGSQQTDTAVKQSVSHKRSLSPKSQPNKKPHQQHPPIDERSCKDSHRSCAYDKEEIQQYIKKKRQQQKQKKTQPSHPDRPHRNMAPLDTNLKRKSPASTNKSVAADSDKENRAGCDVTVDKTKISKQQRANAETVHKELRTDESMQPTLENISQSGWNPAVPKSSSVRFVASNSSHHTASGMASNVTATVGSRSQVTGGGLEMSDLSSHKRPNFFKIQDSLPVYNSGLSFARSSPNTSILNRKHKLSLLAASLNSRLEEFSETFARQGSSSTNQLTKGREQLSVKQFIARQHNSDSSSSTLTESQHSGYADAIDCIYNLHNHHQNAAFASQSAELALQTRRPLLAHHVGNVAGATAIQGPMIALNYSYMDDTSIEQDVDREQHSRSKLAWKARPRGADDFYPQQTKDADRHQDQLSSGDSSHSQSSAIDDQPMQFSSPSRQELVRQMTKLDAKFLTAREKELHQRREKVETLLAWKLKLDEEEREIERLEKEVALLELHPDDSQSFVLSETMLSEHSDSESRIKALQEELKRKKVIVEQLKKEQRVKKTQELRRKDVELSKEIAVLQNSDKKRPLDSCSNLSGDRSQTDVKSMQDSLKTDSQINRHRKPESQRDHQPVSAGSSKRELRLEPRTSAKHNESAPADEMVMKSASIRKGSDSNDNENSDDTTLPSADLISEAHVASPDRLDIVDFENTTDSFLVNAELVKGQPVSQSGKVDVQLPAARTDVVSTHQDDDKSTSSTLPFVSASKESRSSKCADRTPSPSRSSKLPGPVNKLNTVNTGSVEPKGKSSDSPVISSKSDSTAAKSPQVSGHSADVKKSSLGQLGDDKKRSMATEPVDGSQHESRHSESPKQLDVIGGIDEQLSSSTAAEKSSSRSESPRSRDISDRSPDRSKLSISASRSEQSADRGKRSKSPDKSEHSVTSGKMPRSPDHSERSRGSEKLTRSLGSSDDGRQPVHSHAGLDTLGKQSDHSSEVSDRTTGLKKANADTVSSESESMSRKQKRSSQRSKLMESKSGSSVDSVSESSATVNYSEDFSTPSVRSKKGSVNKSAASKHSNLEFPGKVTSDDNVVDECQETDEDISEDLVAAEISEADSVSSHKIALDKPDERVKAIPVANSLNRPISSVGLKPTSPVEEKPSSSDGQRKQRLSLEMDAVVKSENPAGELDVIADSVQLVKRHDTGDDVSDLSRYIERTDMVDEISLDNEQLPLDKFDTAPELVTNAVSASNGSGLADSLGVSLSDSTTANNTDDLERLINMAAAAVESFASTGLSDFVEPFGTSANKKDVSCDKTIDSTTKNLLMDAVDEMLSIRNNKLSETQTHNVVTSPVKQLDRSTASDSSDNQADDMQLSGSEEWIDDDFGVRPPPPPYSSVAPNNVDKPFPLEAVAAFTAPGQVGAMSPAANAASQLVIGSFSIVPRTNDEILELVDKIIDAFWECRRYGERWDGKQPPADYFTPSESRSSTAEHVSQRVYKQLLLDLVTEILTDVFRREEEESSTSSTPDQQFFQMSGLVTSAVQQRCAVAEIPTTIDALRPIVHKRVTSTLKMNSFIENQPSMKAFKWRAARKKHDHVDRLLIYELRQEEQHWISYTDEELDVKMQIADSIFELLISETIDTLRQVSLHRTC